MDGRLLLLSSCDPAAAFNVGHAMQRNKLIYALADAALVACSNYEKGGTWSGAVEQLGKLRLVPIYVREDDGTSKGLQALRKRGALPWPNPTTAEALCSVFTQHHPMAVAEQVHEPSLFDHVAKPSQPPTPKPE